MESPGVANSEREKTAGHIGEVCVFYILKQSLVGGEMNVGAEAGREGRRRGRGERCRGAQQSAITTSDPIRADTLLNSELTFDSIAYVTSEPTIRLLVQNLFAVATSKTSSNTSLAKCFSSLFLPLTRLLRSRP